MRLYVNIDHVATVRQARRTDEPDPVRAAVLAELGGAHGITVHPRRDERHIHLADVPVLAAHLAERHPTVEACVLGEIDVAGATRADSGDDPIPSGYDFANH